MDAYRFRSNHIDQSAADSGEQRIARGKSDNSLARDAAEQCGELLAERDWPEQPLLSRHNWDQVKMSTASQQHIRALDHAP